MWPNIVINGYNTFGGDLMLKAKKKKNGKIKPYR